RADNLHHLWPQQSYYGQSAHPRKNRSKCHLLVQGLADLLSPFLLIRSSNHLNTSAANGQPTSYSSSYHCCTTNLYLYQAPPASARPQLLDIAKRNWYNQQEKRGNLDCNHSTNVQHIEPPPADHK